MAQREISPHHLIDKIGLPRQGGQYEDTYLCLQCRQRVVDRSAHGINHRVCPSCGRCFIVGSDHRVCGNCYWRLSLPCGCACGCSQARLPTFRLCSGCSPRASLEMWKAHRMGAGSCPHPVCGYILGGHQGAALVWERHIAGERQRERDTEVASVRKRAERAERWSNADSTEREAMLSERWEARKT